MAEELLPSKSPDSTEVATVRKTQMIYAGNAVAAQLVAWGVMGVATPAVLANVMAHPTSRLLGMELLAVEVVALIIYCVLPLRTRLALRVTSGIVFAAVVLPMVLLPLLLDLMLKTLASMPPIGP